MAPPAAVPENTKNPQDPQQETVTQENGQSKAPPPNAAQTNEKSESAHAEDRREHESTRVKEARKYNNRDRHRHDGDNDDRPYKKRTFTRHNKFDASSLPESSDPAQIRKQVLSIT